MNWSVWWTVIICVFAEMFVFCCFLRIINSHGSASVLECVLFLFHTDWVSWWTTIIIVSVYRVCVVSFSTQIGLCDNYHQCLYGKCAMLVFQHQAGTAGVQNAGAYQPSPLWHHSQVMESVIIITGNTVRGVRWSVLCWICVLGLLNTELCIVELENTEIYIVETVKTKICIEELPNTELVLWNCWTPHSVLWNW